MKPIDPLLRLPEVLKLFPVSKSKWWDGIQNGIYPQPLRVSERISAWRTSDIQALLQKIEEDNGYVE